MASTETSSEISSVHVLDKRHWLWGPVRALIGTSTPSETPGDQASPELTFTSAVTARGTRNDAPVLLDHPSQAPNN